ncbi:MAG: TolC family protein [Legionellales bacterium]|nr:TolC family protein [Legionellales bacterium]
MRTYFVPIYKQITWTFLCLLVLLSACQHYTPQPLSNQIHFSSLQSEKLTIATTTFPFQGQAIRTVKPSEKWGRQDIALLAVINNPALNLIRDDAKVSSAQAFAAGLLPDPKIEGAQDFPYGSPPPGSTTGYLIGPTYDYMSSLLSYSANKAASSATQKQVNLTVLWQEWQTISQSQILYTRTVSFGEQLDLLRKQKKLLERNYKQIHFSFEKGNSTLDEVDSQLAALNGLNQQMNVIVQQYNQNQHDLNLFLNLPPETVLLLSNDLSFPHPDKQYIEDHLQTWLSKRADMLALQAGYESQDEQFRAAILGQFPAVLLGLNLQRGTDALKSYGYTFSLGLPVFNGNKGNVAIARTTRQKLYDDYQQRLNTAYSDIILLLKQQALLESAEHSLKQRASSAAALALASDQAYKQGNIDLKTYTNANMNALSARLELIALQQTLLEQGIALQTQIGSSVPMESGKK